MPKHFLNRSQIGPFVEKVGGKGVAQRMGTHRATGKPVRIAGYNAGDASGREASASAIAKDRQ
jgi:hypothetical protein